MRYQVSIEPRLAVPNFLIILDVDKMRAFRSISETETIITAPRRLSSVTTARRLQRGITWEMT